MLFRDGLVMYDRETDTLWTQVDGKAVKGALTGRKLEVVPSVHATWKQWKQLYPDSIVLKKRGIPRSAYEGYNRDPNRAGILGRRRGDKRLPPKERVIGVRTEEAATAFVEKDVRDARLVQAEVGPLPVVLVAAGDDHPVVTFNRKVSGRVLSFRLPQDAPAVMEDIETGSRWSLADGKAISGSLKGAQLERAPAYPAFWFGWKSYFRTPGSGRAEEGLAAAPPQRRQTFSQREDSGTVSPENEGTVSSMRSSPETSSTYPPASRRKHWSVRAAGSTIQ